MQPLTLEGTEITAGDWRGDVSLTLMDLEHHGVIGGSLNRKGHSGQKYLNLVGRIEDHGENNQLLWLVRRTSEHHRELYVLPLGSGIGTLERLRELSSLSGSINVVPEGLDRWILCLPRNDNFAPFLTPDEKIRARYSSSESTRELGSGQFLPEDLSLILGASKFSYDATINLNQVRY